MTLSLSDLALYAGALLVLFLTPGPVWLAMLARSMSGGFHAAWPLALGVVVGDMLWPFLAILGVSWIVSVFSGFMLALQILAVAMFVGMGFLLIRNADRSIAADSRLTRPGTLAGFMAGLAAILGNPKAILFYMGVLPGFFDLSRITPMDIAAIVFLSFVIPLIGNLSLALFVDRIRRIMSSPGAIRRTNIVSGWLLIVVGAAIALT
ncbi:LysE family translocator [Roseovarius gahaiensis]|uniref:LysE family translocator n=1 Tax=Roseovarius gahaiensis TaxID=2716691 RepID=A0A967B8E7_9RHOB|nr:LysE family translocator [Roseovarius gahaiensis]NHQ73215.1 LysE family translocator [Roseovarius gahaiensis]